MSSSCFYCSRKIAYVSLVANPGSLISDLEMTREYCMSLPFQVDLFAEEIHPNSKVRPLFQEILDRIANDEVSMLIVPSRYHLSGDKRDQMAYLSRFLNHNGVELVCTAKVVPSTDEFSGCQFYAGLNESL